ncbi:putative glycosyl transferase, group 1 family [Nocardioidaceae bacterium Broad-1]|nr:putative glycosyl transferase, group 1 family [Nocardioidaceae bacterium Broad-1]
MSSRKTRVCVINPFGYELFDPAARAARVFGGVEVQLYYLTTALARLDDFEVSMVVERPESTADGVLDGVREGVRMLTVPRERAAMTRIRTHVPIPLAAYLAAMDKAHADVYLQRGGALLTGDVALHCLLHRRRFAFMAAHDWDCDHHHRAGAQYLTGTYYAAGLRRADLVYAQSEFQRDQLERHHGVSSRVQRTVYPPADVAAPAERQHVLWVGRCVDWKRPTVFLDLAESQPDVPFVMACAPYEGEHSLYEAVARRAKTIPNVRFLGFVPFAETEDLFRHAYVAVNTSTAEGFPNTFVQAARVATPVLSLEVDPDGILGKHGLGACAGGDSALLAVQLSHVLDDDATWQRQSRNALDYFRQTHDLDAILPGFAASLRELCDR